MRRLGVSLEPAGVAAVVSVAGAHCGKGDEEAVASLRPDVRRRWLAEHSLSPGVRYYSVVNLPEGDNIRAGRLERPQTFR